MEYKLRQKLVTVWRGCGWGKKREKTNVERVIERSVTTYKGICAFLSYSFLPILLVAQTGSWHPEITGRPRVIFTSSQKQSLIDWVRQDSVARLLHRDLYSAAMGTGTDQRSRSQIAKAAAFVLALGFDPTTPVRGPCGVQIRTRCA